MSKPEGIYLSVDYRVTNSKSGEIVDDSASKCLRIDYPPIGNGLKALIAFTGVAYLGKTPTLTWLRETLRGEVEYPDQSFAHLRRRLNRDFARLRQPLIFNVLGLHGSQRFFGALSNMKVDGARPTIMNEFGYHMQEIDSQFLFTNGSGGYAAMADSKLRKMTSLLGVTPRSVIDYMKLLAIVNRRVAASTSSVSPFSKVSFVSADNTYPSTSHCFTERGENVNFDMPVLLGGIDLTYLAKELHETTLQRIEGNSLENLPTSDLINKGLRRRP